MFIRKGEVLYYWLIGTVQMYINKYQFCKKHSGKTLHTRHRAQHKHAFKLFCI